MVRIQRGDTDAFSAFYDRHAAAVYGVAHAILGSRGLAEDVTQEAFVGFWRARGHYVDSRGAARSWLLGIARNRAIDATRRPSFGRDRPLEWDFEREAPECTVLEVLRRADASALSAALRALPAGQRQALELGYLVGLSQSEIAERLGVPLGTVKSRTRLGLKKLRAELDDRSPAFAHA